MLIIYTEDSNEKKTLQLFQIEVRISECVNPTTYTAQVLRCYEYKEGKRKLRWSWIQNFNSIRDQLVKHFQIKENR